MKDFLAAVKNKDYVKAMQLEDLAMADWNQDRDLDLTLALASYFEVLGNAKAGTDLPDDLQQVDFNQISYSNTFGMAMEMLHFLVASTQSEEQQAEYLNKITAIQSRWLNINNTSNFTFK